jgi:hypothetical protein
MYRLFDYVAGLLVKGSTVESAVGDGTELDCPVESVPVFIIISFEFG